MAYNVVAYIGCDSFDFILYLAHILQKLGRKVLVVDYSETEALISSIPSIDGIDTDNGILTFQRIDFTGISIDRKMLHSYDDVLVDFGFTEPEIDLSMLTRIVYVTDLFQFHINRLMQNPFSELPIPKKLLIRDAIDMKISAESIAAKLDKQISKMDISVLFRDDKDYENSLTCHNNQLFCCFHISGMLKEYLIQEAGSFCSNIPSKQIKSAYAKIRKVE